MSTFSLSQLKNDISSKLLEREIRFTNKRSEIVTTCVVNEIYTICDKYYFTKPNLSLLTIDITEYKKDLIKQIESWNVESKSNNNKNNNNDIINNINIENIDIKYKELLKKHWNRARNWFDQNKYKTVGKSYWIKIFKSIEKISLNITNNINDNILKKFAINLLLFRIIHKLSTEEIKFERTKGQNILGLAIISKSIDIHEYFNKITNGYICISNWIKEHKKTNNNVVRVPISKKIYEKYLFHLNQLCIKYNNEYINKKNQINNILINNIIINENEIPIIKKNKNNSENKNMYIQTNNYSNKNNFNGNNFISNNNISKNYINNDKNNTDMITDDILNNDNNNSNYYYTTPQMEYCECCGKWFPKCCTISNSDKNNTYVNNETNNNNNHDYINNNTGNNIGNNYNNNNIGYKPSCFQPFYNVSQQSRFHPYKR